MVARTILETLRAVVDDPNDVDAVLNVMKKLSDDVGKWKSNLYFKEEVKEFEVIRAHQAVWPDLWFNVIIHGVPCNQKGHSFFIKQLNMK